MYGWCWCGVNRPVWGVLIDLFSPVSFSLAPVPREACFSPGSTAASPVLCPPCSLTAWGQVARRGPNQGRDNKQKPREDWNIIFERIRLSDLITIVRINPILFFSPTPPFMFAAFAVWCRNTWKRETNWHLTKSSTRKSVSLNTFIHYTSKKAISTQQYNYQSCVAFLWVTGKNTHLLAEWNWW